MSYQQSQEKNGAPQGYTPQPTMEPVIPSDKGASPLQPVQPFKPGSFQHGLFACFDSCGTCCLGTWCPCILFGRSRARLQNPQLKRGDLPYCSPSCCGYACVLIVCPPFQCLFGWMQRGDVRARYDIEGGGCGDCLAHFCCDCCVCPLYEWK